MGVIWDILGEEIRINGIDLGDLDRENIRKEYKIEMIMCDNDLVMRNKGLMAYALLCVDFYIDSATLCVPDLINAY